MLNYAGGTPVTAYNLTRSLRFRASASASLSRTPATATNRTTWTWSAWVKRGYLGTGTQVLFGTLVGVLDATYTTIAFRADTLIVDGYTTNWRTSTQVFRDPSAWYHIVVALDTTQATAANRLKLYVNGSQITAFTTSNDPTLSQALGINNSALHQIAQTGAFDGYLAEVNFVDGQQLTPSSFGSTNSLTGVWQPAKYSGSYSTNGFYLPFTDNSALTTASNVGLGKDFSGNTNYWVTNNISITAGVTYDSMTDVPTLTSATAANYCVLNPLLKQGGSSAFSDGNLTALSAYDPVIGSMGASSGKYYCEVTNNGAAMYIGIVPTGYNSTSGIIGTSATSYSYVSNGTKYNNSVNPAYGATYTTGDVIGIAMDLDGGSLTFYKNNTSQGVAYTGITGTYFFAFVMNSSTVTANINFGQQGFKYTPPTGYVAMNAYNLPTSTILQGNKVMDATLYTGTLLSNAVTNAAAFKPDLVWVKSRSAATEHKESNSVRGVTKATKPNSTDPETTDVQGITAFNSNGFTVGTNTDYNNLAATYVAWQWQAGQGSSSSNTNGTITSTVSVNASAGCSILTFTGTGANATVGHGLGVAPSMFLVKNLANAAGNWAIAHTSLTSFSGYAIYLNSTAAQFAAGTFWNSLAPTSSVLNLGSSPQINESAQPMMAQVWAAIAGFSSFGSYTGNGSADGAFVYTGFRPKLVWVKSRDGVSGWRQYDTTRSPANLTNLFLQSSSSAAEQSSAGSIDILSNGFKLRDTDTSVNGSASVYIYAAWAENPFKNSLAR